MLKFFRLPFATTGDKTAVPDAVDTNGNVSYSQGYGFDYQRQKTDPAAKNIERDKMNQIFFDVTTAVAELQANGIPDFITTALNGGTAYSYAQYAVVKYSGDLYISLVAANTALPSDATKWALLPTPARIQAAFNTAVVAAGTADALTGAFSPAIAALPAAPGTLSALVRAGSANATATPTFKADDTTAKTIIKGNNLPLVAGDIAGAGHWLDLQYDATLDKWVLQNPATGISPSGKIAGDVVQTAYHQRVDYATISANIPYDDTIPQITEGTEIFSVSITPQASTDILEFEVLIEGTLGTTTGTFLIGALFKDGGANAIAACFGVSMDQSIAGGAGQLALNFKVAAGGTAAQTYTFRIGSNSGSFYLNGNSGGRKLGGVVPAYMQITEKKV